MGNSREDSLQEIKNRIEADRKAFDEKYGYLMKELENFQIPEDYNPYRDAMENVLSAILPDYPNTTKYSLSIDFKNNSTQYGDVVYLILEHIPSEHKRVEKQFVKLEFHGENTIVDNFEAIVDIVSLSKKWASFSMVINQQPFAAKNFGYYSSYLCEKYHITLNTPQFDGAKFLRLKYQPTQPRKKKSSVEDAYFGKFPLLYENMKNSLGVVVDAYEKIYLTHFSSTRFQASDLETILLIENEYVVSFRVELENQNNPNTYLMIREFTKNTLFKYTHAAFQRAFNPKASLVQFEKFYGTGFYTEKRNHYNSICDAFPELKLPERLSSYQGEDHHIVVFEMLGRDGKRGVAVATTTGKVYSFVLKVCKELEEKASSSLRVYGLSCLKYSSNNGFFEAFLSWKGEKKKERLEKRLRYYYFDKTFKDNKELYTFTRQVLDGAATGRFDNQERGTYSKPVNRWKSEEYTFSLTQKLYNEYNVIYQYRPFFLGGMSYDIYICGLKIAIEYQGKQHFEPVEFFGGKENFESQRERDQLKLKLSAENGVDLIYINYWEDITSQLIRSKVEAVLRKRFIN